MASKVNSSMATTDGVDNGIKGPITWDDATWILTSAFIIFTMQSGFGMLESGAVASRNTVNIMVKNVVDVVFGGMTYWMFGYALSFGQGPYSNPFCGVGDFFVDTDGEDMGLVYATFVFQLSFATTATTIVSGAMAERTNLTAYIVFSLLNTIVYCIPAHWVWGSNGFLAQLGAVDFAGSGVVHLVGACSGLVATLMLKPRTGRYEPGQQWPSLVNPVNAIIGTFMLWWGWLAFNCGSTFGISGGKWMLASKAAFTTLIASMAGGITGTLVSVAEFFDVVGKVKRFLCIASAERAIVSSYLSKRGKYDVGYLINSILGSLVAITASCPLVRSYEAVIIGMVGALCTLGCCRLMERLQIDDPVCAVAVHGASGMWGLLAVGLFVEDDNLEDLTKNRNGLLKGGGFYLLGIQVLTIVCEACWSLLTTFIMLFLIDKTLGLRVSPEEERLGADFCEHGVGDATWRLSQLLNNPSASHNRLNSITNPSASHSPLNSRTNPSASHNPLNSRTNPSASHNPLNSRSNLLQASSSEEAIDDRPRKERNGFRPRSRSVSWFDSNPSLGSVQEIKIYGDHVRERTLVKTVTKQNVKGSKKSPSTSSAASSPPSKVGRTKRRAVKGSRLVNGGNLPAQEIQDGSRNGRISDDLIPPSVLPL